MIESVLLLVKIGVTAFLYRRFSRSLKTQSFELSRFYWFIFSILCFSWITQVVGLPGLIKNYINYFENMSSLGLEWAFPFQLVYIVFFVPAFALLIYELWNEVYSRLDLARVLIVFSLVLSLVSNTYNLYLGRAQFQAFTRSDVGSEMWITVSEFVLEIVFTFFAIRLMRRMKALQPPI